MNDMFRCICLTLSPLSQLFNSKERKEGYYWHYWFPIIHAACMEFYLTRNRICWMNEIIMFRWCHHKFCVPSFNGLKSYHFKNIWTTDNLERLKDILKFLFRKHVLMNKISHTTSEIHGLQGYDCSLGKI